jgi:hypothetical protein
VNGLAANVITAASINADAITAAKVAADVHQETIELAFTYNATADYATATAGSLVKEIADNAGGSALTAAAIADAVWDEAQADHVTAGSFGITASEIADILVDTAVIGAAGAGLTALPPVTLANSVTHGGTGAVLSISQLLITASDGNPNILLTGSGAADGLSFTRSGAGGVFDTEFAAALQQEAADALNAYDPPTNTEMVARTIVAADYATATAVADLPTNAELATALGTADDAVLAQVALVKAKTDSLTFTVAGQVDANIQSINDVTITGNGGVTPFNVV